MKNILVISGVVFPDIEFTARSEEIIPEIIYDVRTTDITEYINRVFDYWEDRLGWQTSNLSKTEVEDIVNFLRGETV